MITINTATISTTVIITPFYVVVCVETLLKKKKKNRSKASLPRTSLNKDVTPRPSHKPLYQSLRKNLCERWRLSISTMTRLLSDGRTSAFAGAPVGGRGHGRTKRQGAGSLSGQRGANQGYLGF